MTINWKTRLFSSVYRLFTNDRQTGHLDDKIWNTTAMGELNNQRFEFQRKGFFSSTTKIRNLVSNEVAGQIKYNTWGSKAQIIIGEQSYDWKYDDFWNSKWSMSQGGQPLVKYKSSMFSGQIEVETESELLVLSGLQAHNHYAQITVLIVILIVVVTR